MFLGGGTEGSPWASSLCSTGRTLEQGWGTCGGGTRWLRSPGYQRWAARGTAPVHLSLL